MSVLQIILTIIVVGILLWLVNTYIPMEAMIKKVLNIFVVVGLILWLLYIIGAFNYLSNIRV